MDGRKSHDENKMAQLMDISEALLRALLKGDRRITSERRS